MAEERPWGEPFAPPGEMEHYIRLLDAAVKYHIARRECVTPYTWWADRRSRLYVRWNQGGAAERGPVWRYCFGKGGALQAEKIPVNMKPSEVLRGGNPGSPAVLVTGDTHGRFGRIEAFCRKFRTMRDDVMIILGDAGINYTGGVSDDAAKHRLSGLDITLFCVRGNHEMRPESVGTYRAVEWRGGRAYVEDRYPNLVFAKDGEIYDIAGHKTLVIGGAYSVDKHFRLQKGCRWFPDEQLAEDEWGRIYERLDGAGWEADAVLKHTVPYRYRPVDKFIRGLDQAAVDTSTEERLGEIEGRLDYKRWYAGHFHIDRVTGRVRLMYRKVALFMEDTDLKFEMA